MPTIIGIVAIAIPNEPKLIRKNKEPKPTASKLPFNGSVYYMFVYV